jgi:hypothetical protein
MLLARRGFSFALGRRLSGAYSGFLLLQFILLFVLVVVIAVLGLIGLTLDVFLFIIEIVVFVVRPKPVS